jgi:hypothetical protein
MKQLQRHIEMNEEFVGWTTSYQYIIINFTRRIGLCYTRAGTPYKYILEQRDPWEWRDIRPISLLGFPKVLAEWDGDNVAGRTHGIGCCWLVPPSDFWRGPPLWSATAKPINQQTHLPNYTGCSTQTVASRDKRMDRSHAVGMCKSKAKYSLSPIRFP